MRVWKASGADPRCTLSFTRATVAPLYVAFHTPCFTSRRRQRSRSTPYFIPLATRTNGASAFPDALRASEPLENDPLGRVSRLTVELPPPCRSVWWKERLRLRVRKVHLHGPPFDNGLGGLGDD